MGRVLVKAEGLRRRFFRKGRESARYFDAVANASLQLHAGELVALRGRSGSGKSTLLNLVSGLLEPTEGRVELDGVDLYSLSDAELSRLRNEKIGVVPQGQTLLHALSAVENVKLPYVMYRVDDGAEARAMELLGQLGVAHLADAHPRELSGGEMRRVAIARALVCGPCVVLADEPTSDLDDENTEAVLSLLRRVADEGAAVLVVTHEAAVERVADRVLRMDAGELLHDRAADDLPQD